MASKREVISASNPIWLKSYLLSSYTFWSILFKLGTFSELRLIKGSAIDFDPIKTVLSLYDVILLPGFSKKTYHKFLVLESEYNVSIGNEGLWVLLNHQKN